MRILVTGAAGFVGSRTCSHLEVAGHEIVRIVHARKTSLLNEYAVDSADPGTFTALDDIREIDAVVHCAGIAHRFGRTSRDEYWRVNVDGAKNITEFAVRKQVPHFIHLSSVLVYGRPTSSEPITESQTPAPDDDYSSSKLAGEIAVAEVCKGSDIRLTILRPVPIIGAGSRGNVARLIRAIARKRFIWIGDGRNKRSFVDVSDVAETIVSSLSDANVGGTFNVTGGTMTVREMVEDISELLGRSNPVRLVPHKIAKVAAALSKPLASLPMAGRYHHTLETWLSDAVYSGEALKKLGFLPATNVRDALRNEVKAYLGSKQ
jgi:UDP-glucose 4-epimerase